MSFLHLHERSPRLAWAIEGFGVVTLALVAGVCLAAVTAGCSSNDNNRNEPVGRSKTVEKRTMETPEGRTTVTETREKNTRVVPR